MSAANAGPETKAAPTTATPTDDTIENLFMTTPIALLRVRAPSYPILFHCEAPVAKIENLERIRPRSNSFESVIVDNHVLSAADAAFGR
jgi:hypothetical protein